MKTLELFAAEFPELGMAVSLVEQGIKMLGATVVANGWREDEYVQSLARIAAFDAVGKALASLPIMNASTDAAMALGGQEMDDVTAISDNCGALAKGASLFFEANWYLDNDVLEVIYDSKGE